MLSKERPRWSIWNPSTAEPARKWTPFGLMAGMSAGIIVSLFVTGRPLPGMGFGMFIGALAGAYFDKQIGIGKPIRPRLLVVIASLFGIGSALLWYLSHS